MKSNLYSNYYSGIPFLEIIERYGVNTLNEMRRAAKAKLPPDFKVSEKLKVIPDNSWTMEMFGTKFKFKTYTMKIDFPLISESEYSQQMINALIETKKNQPNTFQRLNQLVVR